MLRRDTVTVTGVIPRDVYDGLCNDAVVTGLSMSKMVAQAMELYLKNGGQLAFMEMKVNEGREGKITRRGQE